MAFGLALAAQAQTSNLTTSAVAYALSNLKTTAGAAFTLQQGDMVIVAVQQAYTAARTLAQLTPTGYLSPPAPLNAVMTSTDTNITSAAVFYKFMGATPDTTITIPASAATTGALAVEISVIRGVDQTTPFAGVTPTTATGINGGQPNAASITTPAKTGTWVVAFLFASMATTATALTNPATNPYDSTTGFFKTLAVSATNAASMATGIKTGLAASTAYDAGACAGGTTTNTASWAAASFVLQPDQPASITSPSSFSQSENSAFSTTLTANETVTWSLVGGTDQALFSLSGATLSLAAKDFEAPTDSNADNIYQVTVRATDSGGNTTDQTISVTITNVGPTITSSGTTSVSENSALSFSLTANESATWAIIGGADASQFQISGSTLQWVTNKSQSYAAPADANADNVYVVTVRATDAASEYAQQTISVTVIPVLPPPVVSSRQYILNGILIDERGARQYVTAAAAVQEMIPASARRPYGYAFILG